MSDVARIRGFLIQHPKPALIRVTADGECQELKPHKSYQRCAETVAALDPEKIELYDSSRQLLRAMSLDDENAQRSAAADIPAGIAADPHALMITHFANLLHRAYEHSTEIAFGKLVDLTERLNERSEAVEQRLERAEAQYRRLANDQIEAALDRAEEAQAQQGKDGLGEQLLGSFLGGARQPKAAEQKATNGKGQS